MTRAGELWRILAVLFAAATPLLLAGCQLAAPIPASTPNNAPTLVVGDHWQYRITDNLRRGAVTMLDTEVVSIANGIASLRLVYDGPYGRSEETEQVNANGWLVVGAIKQDFSRQFPTPIQMYDFPLEQGKTWRQVVNTISPETGLPAQILTFGTVQGLRSTTVPAGTFDAIYLYRIIQLDDAQFFRTRTERRDSVWFDGRAKGPVRELRDASFIELSGPDSDTIRVENTIRELLSFRPGPK
ncbi:MAG: hypothetical protein ABI537_00675 [Casimicrobiaceae bacterium]